MTSVLFETTRDQEGHRVSELHPATDLSASLRQSLVASASTIGIRFDRLRAEARGCRLSIDGSPIEFAPQIRSSMAEPLSSDLLRRFTSIERDASTIADRELLTNELTDIAIRLAEQLMGGTIGSKQSSKQTTGTESADEILAIGVHGSGVWQLGDDESRCYREYINASRIAEQLGKTVIDDFPSRDLSQGGRGGPVEAHGNWVLLADRTTGPGCHWRALLDITPHATHFSLIGPIGKHLRTVPILSNDICVGSRLMSEIIAASRDTETNDRANEKAKDRSNNKTTDEKTDEKTDGCDFVDVNELAGQGEPIPELLELWQATNGRKFGWQPSGLSALPFVYALQNSVFAKSATQNLLCSATHFLAREIDYYVKRCVPASTPVGEIFIMGEGSKSRLLVELLEELLPGVCIRRLSELGQDRTIHAASIAALALLHIWQIPLPSTNTGEVPRVLGRLTPGSPSNWQRVLHAMTSNAPWLLPLREAI